jgi:uncharacterized protein (TIGR03435 family)
MDELKGNYEVTFRDCRQDLLNAARAAGAKSRQPRPILARLPMPLRSGRSIFNAMQTLGLKLEPRSAALMIVVDKAEKMPTDN